MEKYINTKTIIKNDIYNMFKDSVICPLCKDIYIEPVMCMKCQEVFCKRCIDERLKEKKECPGKKKCEDPDYQECKGKVDILKTFCFNCYKCGKKILYTEVKTHMESCSNEGSNINENCFLPPETPLGPSGPKMTKISKEELEKIKDGKEMNYITCKIFIFLFSFFINSNHIGRIESRKN